MNAYYNFVLEGEAVVGPASYFVASALVLSTCGFKEFERRRLHAQWHQLQVLAMHF